MIKVKDISKVGYNELIKSGDVNLCFDTIRVGKDKSYVNILIHDGCRINYIKKISSITNPNSNFSRNDIKVSVSIANKIVNISFTDLVTQFVGVYNIYDLQKADIQDIFTTLDPGLSYKFPDTLLDKTKAENSFIVFIPEGILDVAEKIGLSRNVFINDYLYLILANNLNNYNEKTKIIEEYLNMCMRDIYYKYELASSLDKKRMYNDNTLLQMLIMIMKDVMYKLATICKSPDMLRTQAMLDDTNKKVARYLFNAFLGYVKNGSKEGLQELYNYLNNNREDFGLNTYILMNYLENVLSQYGAPMWDTIIRDNSGYTVLNKRLVNLIHKYSTETYSESYFGENMVASQLFAIVNTDKLPVSNPLDTIKPSITEDNLTKVTPEVDNKTTVDYHTMNFRRYLDKINEYKKVTVFETPEERKEMVNKFVRILDELDVHKKNYDMTDGVTYKDINSDKTKKLALYDVLKTDIHSHIDFLNNIKYYGTDKLVHDLNVEAYTNNEEGASENFKLLSSQVGYIYDIDSTDTLKSSAEEGGFFNKIKDNLPGGKIYDNEGNLVRKRSDKKTFQNMTKQEMIDYQNRVGYMVMYPNDIYRFDGLRRAFFAVAKPIHHILKSLPKLLRGILHIITMGEFAESEVISDDLFAFGEAYFDFEWTDRKDPMDVIGNRPSIDDLPDQEKFGQRVKRYSGAVKKSINDSKAVDKIKNTNNKLWDKTKLLKAGLGIYVTSKLDNMFNSSDSKKASRRNRYNDIIDYDKDEDDDDYYYDPEKEEKEDDKKIKTSKKEAAEVEQPQKEPIKPTMNKSKLMWIRAKCIFLDTVVIPTISLINRTKSNKNIKDKLALEKSIKEVQESRQIVEEILKSNLPEYDKNVLIKLQTVLNGDFVKYDVKKNKEAKSEALKINEFNKIKLKEIKRVDSPEVAKEMNKLILDMVFKSVKIDKTDTIKFIYQKVYKEGGVALYVIVIISDKKPIVLNMEDSYEYGPILDTINNINTPKFKIVVEHDTFDFSTLNKNTDVNSLDEKELKDIMNSSDDEEVKRSAIKEFENRIKEKSLERVKELKTNKE